MNTVYIVDSCRQWRNDGVAAASDGGGTGGRVLEFLVINFSVCCARVFQWWCISMVAFTHTLRKLLLEEFQAAGPQ